MGFLRPSLLPPAALWPAQHNRGMDRKPLKSSKLRAAGYKPQIIRSEVPGKGIFYRVRVGDYATRQAADQARAEYEKKQHANVIVAPW